MIGIVNQLFFFFSSYPKHQKKVEEAIHNALPKSNMLNLQDLCLQDKMD